MDLIKMHPMARKLEKELMTYMQVEFLYSNLPKGEVEQVLLKVEDCPVLLLQV